MTRLLTVLFAMLAVLLSMQVAKAERLLVYAAASMKEAVEEISDTYEKFCDCQIVVSLGGTGMLARQVAQGAPADIFISADAKWIEYLSNRQAIKTSSIKEISSNQLIIAVAKSRVIDKKPLLLLSKNRFAIADPLSVPAGRYAKEALENLGKWSAFRPNAVQTENVRIALAMVARGDVAAAIVYESDLLVEPRVKGAYRFASASHSKIQYLATLTSTAKPEAGAFLEFLQSDTAQTILQNYGFSAVTDK